MAIESASEIFAARTGAWTADEGRHYERVFQVWTTTPLDGPNAVCQATGVRIGDQYIFPSNPYESDQYAYCNSITPSQIEGDGLGWLVKITYGPYSCLWCGGGPDQNPLLQPIDVSWGMTKQEFTAQMDLFGKPILNTAGAPYDPPLMEDDPRPVLTVIRNEPTFPRMLQAQYSNAINSDSFAGYDPLMVRVIEISGKLVCHQFVGWYWQCTYQFECMPPKSQFLGINGYRRTVVNQGMTAISQVTGKVVKPSDNGIPIDHPVLLTRQGYRAKATDDPYYNVYQTKPELPFAVFMFEPAAIDGSKSGFMGGYQPPFFAPA